MKTGRNNSNAGFSIIELLIVMAIMGILAGTLTIGASVLTGKKVMECTETIVEAVENAKVLTLGKEQNQVECVLTYDATMEKYIVITYKRGKECAREQVDAEGISIVVYFDGEAMGYNLADISAAGMAGGATGSPSSGLFVLFNRASGAFVEKTNQVGGTVKDYCTCIEVSNTRRTQNIRCVGKTGKITVE